MTPEALAVAARYSDAWFAICIATGWALRFDWWLPKPEGVS